MIQNLIYSHSLILRSENGTWDPSKAGELIERYNSSIGFYVNPASSVSESVDSSTSDFGIGR